MDRSIRVHRGESLKAQAPFGHIQHGSAVIPLQLKEDKLVRHDSKLLPTIQVYVLQIQVP